jgi:hypothetical protein
MANRASDKIPVEPFSDEKIAHFPNQSVDKEAVSYGQRQELYSRGMATSYSGYPSSSTSSVSQFSPAASTQSGWAGVTNTQRGYASSAQYTQPGPSKAQPKQLGGDRKTSAIALIATIIFFTIIWKLSFFSSSSPKVRECIPRPENFRHSGPILAIMGGSGTGKSSFIRDLQGRDSKGCLPEIGHTLQSCKLFLRVKMFLVLTYTHRYEECQLVLCYHPRNIVLSAGYTRVR